MSNRPARSSRSCSRSAGSITRRSVFDQSRDCAQSRPDQVSGAGRGDPIICKALVVESRGVLARQLRAHLQSRRSDAAQRASHGDRPLAIPDQGRRVDSCAAASGGGSRRARARGRRSVAGTALDTTGDAGRADDALHGARAARRSRYAGGDRRALPRDGQTSRARRALAHQAIAAWSPQTITRSPPVLVWKCTSPIRTTPGSAA